MSRQRAQGRKSRSMTTIGKSLFPINPSQSKQPHNRAGMGDSRQRLLYRQRTPQRRPSLPGAKIIEQKIKIIPRLWFSVLIEASFLSLPAHQKLADQTLARYWETDRTSPEETTDDELLPLLPGNFWLCPSQPQVDV